MVNAGVYPQPNRPPAMGVNGMVSSAHPAASVAGLRVLMDGGNAIDATVATVAALNVAEPYMSGLGGIGVALVYVAREGRVRALDFSGRAPSGAEPSVYVDDEARGTGILSCLVPGNVSRMDDASRRLWLDGHGAALSARHPIRRERRSRNAFQQPYHGRFRPSPSPARLLSVDNTRRRGATSAAGRPHQDAAACRVVSPGRQTR